MHDRKGFHQSLIGTCITKILIENRVKFSHNRLDCKTK